MAGPDETRRKAVTLKDVARHAGVSMSTASRALSGRRRVDGDLIRRVHEAASRLKYRPNLAARSLRTARSMSLGIVFSRLESPVALEVLAGMDEVTHGEGYTLLVGNAGGDPAQLDLLLRRLLEQGIDGLAIYRPGDVEAALRLYEAAGVPVLGVYARGPGAGSLPLVANEPGEAIALAISRAAALGHRSVAYLGTPSELGDVRSSKMAEAAGAEGLAFRALSVFDDAEPAPPRALERLLAARDRPAMLFVRHRHLPTLLTAVRERALRVPDDLSVVSLGDSTWLTALSPPFAAIHPDGRELGQAAARVLLEWIAGTEPPAVTLLPSAEWRERPSLGPAPGHNRDVAGRNGPPATASIDR